MLKKSNKTIYYRLVGGFDLQNDASASEMTDRLLSMLNQFLISHQSLQLNETFQIYLKILSIEHSKFKASQKPRRQAKKIVRTHVGASKRKYNYSWAIDVPPVADFAQKCLLTCTLLALAQHIYFESGKKNKSFLYMSMINSNFEKKKQYAFKIMKDQLEKLFQVVNLKRTGPYELKSTIKLLSRQYQCQFFIFDAMNTSSKMYYMYPKVFEDSLKPIYLFRPQFDSNHLIFIRRLSSFFKSNGFVCFSCLRCFKRFRDSRSPHLCKKRPTCFACRCFFQTQVTYLNNLTTMNFCDKLTTDENSFNCPRCNCIIFSSRCFKNHKKFCNGKGYFGYKCSDCKTFSYCKNNTSEELKLQHVCNGHRTCRYCYLVKEKDHQCPLKF